MPHQPLPDDAAFARSLMAQAADLRRHARTRAKQVAQESARQVLSEAEKKARALEATAQVFAGRSSFADGQYAQLSNKAMGDKWDPMYSRVNMSRGKKSSSKLKLAANAVGHSVRSLAEAVANDPRIQGTGYGCTAAQLSAAEHGKCSIRRIVTEVVRDLTKHGPIPADPSRGIEAQEAYDGIPLDYWKNVIEDRDEEQAPSEGAAPSGPSMSAAHRIALSASRARDRFSAAVRQSGRSVNGFAELPEVDVSPTLLRAAHKGTKPIRESVCIRVRNALGKNAKGEWIFAATRENWPKIRLGV